MRPSCWSPSSCGGGRRAAGDRALRLLSAILFAIGLGSFLFHTTATIWAALADTLPIAAFVLVYLFLVNRRALHMGVTAAGLATLAFLPLAGLLAAGLARVPFLAISGLYWSVPAALAVYGAMLRRSHPRLVRGFAVGAGLLTVSITLRSLDMMLCDAWPVGTHFAWHLLNALMLGWMIHVALRDLSPPPLAAPRAGR